MNVLTILFLIILPLSAFAWGGKNLEEEASSPWTTDARPVLIGGATLTLLALVIEDRTDRYQNELVEDKPLGKWSAVGDFAGQWIPNITYILGQSIADMYGNDKGKERAMGMLKASLYSSAVTTGLKYTIREPRPNNHNDRNSFPSGHSTTAFAFAGYVLGEHGWAWGAPALGLASLSGISRINDNMHRLQDVFAGATIGLTYGLGISYLAKKESTVTSYQFAPIWDQQYKGLVVTKSF